MKKILLIVILLCNWILLKAQCDYVWTSNENKIHTSNYLIDPKIKFDSLNILFSKVIEKVRFVRIDEKSEAWLDSLKRGEISDSTYLPFNQTFFARGNEEWWLELTYNKVGFLLTKVDTLKLETEKICVYRISTNLSTFWNEDFDNWEFYYCKELGIIKYDKEFISEPNFGESYILTDKTCLTYKTIFENIRRQFDFSLSKK